MSQPEDKMPPLDQSKTREEMLKIINDDSATLVSPTEGVLKSNTPIEYLCACGEPHKKSLNNFIHGNGGALCPTCAKERGRQKRLKTLEEEGITTINKGETEFNRELAEKSASKDNSVLIGIYRQEKDGSRGVEIKGSKASRDCFLHIKCSCGEEDFINFRRAYDGLCRCFTCRTAHKTHVQRKNHRGDEDVEDDPFEPPLKRTERIERDGQKCTDCKEHKPASAFFGHINQNQKCKVYKGRCYECSRKLRTSNREEALRNGSLEDFIKAEITVAKDRNSKYNRKHPDALRGFNITVDCVVELFEKQDGKCALSGLPMATMTHRDECPDDEKCNPNKLSIDRIDSSRGYVDDNIQLVCCWANLMKLDMSSDVFIDRIRMLYMNLVSPSTPSPVTHASASEARRSVHVE